jgi:hypothetical protein
MSSQLFHRRCLRYHTQIMPASLVLSINYRWCHGIDEQWTMDNASSPNVKDVRR